MDTLTGASGGTYSDKLLRSCPIVLEEASVSQTLSEASVSGRLCWECWLPLCSLCFSVNSRRAAVYLLMAMTDTAMQRAKELQARLSTKGIFRKRHRAMSQGFLLQVRLVKNLLLVLPSLDLDFGSQILKPSRCAGVAWWLREQIVESLCWVCTGGLFPSLIKCVT